MHLTKAAEMLIFCLVLRISTEYYGPNQHVVLFPYSNELKFSPDFQKLSNFSGKNKNAWKRKSFNKNVNLNSKKVSRRDLSWDGLPSM